MKLGVPLQTQDIGLALQTYGFYQAVFCTFRFDAQPLAQGPDGLVVDGNDLAASRFRIKLAEATPCFPDDGVGVPVVIIRT